MEVGKDLTACIDAGRGRRVSLNCAAILTEADGSTLDVTIVDVSSQTFRLTSLAELETGSEVLLQMDKVAAVRGEIRWTCGHHSGGVFLDPIAL